jgi:hypothetical protein
MARQDDPHAPAVDVNLEGLAPDEDEKTDPNPMVLAPRRAEFEGWEVGEEDLT